MIFARKHSFCRISILTTEAHKKDIRQIKQRSNGSLLLTTEKDFIRLNPVIDSNLLFYLEIEMKLNKEDEEQLNQIILSTSKIN